MFGPVVTIAPFDDDEDAIRSANDTRYGLNAMVFTRDLSRAHRASAALRAGTVWVNCFFVRDLRAPFGGVGRECGGMILSFLLGGVAAESDRLRTVGPQKGNTGFRRQLR